MTLTTVDDILDRALVGRRLLHHPFYRRWERGEVSTGELAAYAGQYRHFEAYLPGFLARLAGQMPQGRSRELVEANLADELGDPVPHAERFESFARAVGAKGDEPSPAMKGLLAAYDEMLALGPGAALAGFLAYEVQSAEVARSKADGLRRHYGLDDEAVSFWDHHARVDVRHAQWTTEAVTADGDAATEGDLARVADAWWAFLDERDDVALATAGAENP